MKTERNFAVQLLRNGKAVFKRIRIAIRHRDEGEILDSFVNLFEEGAWLFCEIAFLSCLVAGFFKPHCFITAAFYYILILIIRSNIRDRKSSRMFSSQEGK